MWCVVYIVCVDTWCVLCMLYIRMCICFVHGSMCVVCICAMCMCPVCPVCLVVRTPSGPHTYIKLHIDMSVHTEINNVNHYLFVVVSPPSSI